MFFSSFSPWEMEVYEETNSKSAKVLPLGKDRQRAEGKEKPVGGETQTHGKLLCDADGRSIYNLHYMP